MLEKFSEGQVKRRRKEGEKTWFSILHGIGLAVRPEPGTAGGTAVVQSQTAFSLADIEKMLTAQVPEDVIALKVKQSGKTFNLSAEEIIRLKKAASEGLLKLLMAPALGYASRERTADLVIPDGTEVKLLLKNPLSSATAQPEQRIEFTASDAVVVHGVTVIEKRAPAVGHVTEVQARKSYGRKGKLLFSIDTVQAVSGDNIRLRASKTALGTDSYGTAGVVTILTGPLGALVERQRCGSCREDGIHHLPRRR